VGLSNLLSSLKSKTDYIPDYGIDAPDLVKFFFMSGTVALVVFVGTLLSSILGETLRIIIAILSGIVASYLLGMGCFMVYFSKIAKLKESEKLLNLIQWCGDEQVLDVGCGRGLMLIGSAKRLTTGKAIGIDIWQQEDQADNSSAATFANAAIEDVAERIEVKTADMRELPFPENSFDIIISNWTVHNLEMEGDRQKALDEIIRVLKPKGMVVLADIANQAEYARHFELRGMLNVQLHNQPIRDLVLKAISFGSFAPSAVSAVKG